MNQENQEKTLDALLYTLQTVVRIMFLFLVGIVTVILCFVMAGPA